MSKLLSVGTTTLPLSKENYIYLIKLATRINIRDTKNFNNTETPFDVLAKELVKSYNEDSAYGRYIVRENKINSGKVINGDINIGVCISNNSYINGKFVEKAYFNEIKHKYNIEVIELLLKALNILLKFDYDLINKDIIKELKRVKAEIYLDDAQDPRDIHYLKSKYENTELEYTVNICWLIINMTKGIAENNYIDSQLCIESNLRWLIECALREFIKKDIRAKHLEIKVFKDIFEDTINGLRGQSDISVISKQKALVLEVKTGKMDQDSAHNALNQASWYARQSQRKYNMYIIPVIVLYMYGQEKKDSKWKNVMDVHDKDEINQQDDLILNINFQDSDTSVLKDQLQYLSTIIVEYFI